jgi:hypothetical protein
MTRTLFRPAAAAAGLLSIALLLAGCGGDEPPATAPSASQAATGTTTAPEPAAGGGAGGSTETTEAAADGTAAGAAACAPGDVSADLTLQPGGTRGLLAVTNTSGSACRVSGSPGVRLLNPAAEPVPLRVSKVDQPGPAEAVVLEPGRTAFGGLKWTGCDKSSASCGAGNAIEVELPGAAAWTSVELQGFPAPEKVAITMRSLQVGTLQPSHQGVVAW